MFVPNGLDGDLTGKKWRGGGAGSGGCGEGLPVDAVKGKTTSGAARCGRGDGVDGVDGGVPRR